MDLFTRRSLNTQKSFFSWAVFTILTASQGFCQSGSHKSEEKQGSVARIDGIIVYRKDLEPTAKQMEMELKLHPESNKKNVSDQYVQMALSGKIWVAVMKNFSKGKNFEPTKEELDSYLKWLSSVSGKADAKFAQEIAHRMITGWKTDKALYEKYGGIVIFQQGNPSEPVGAYREILEENERSGTFQIFDPKLREDFWAYYKMDHPMKTPKENIDFSKPWWLQRGKK